MGRAKRFVRRSYDKATRRLVWSITNQTRDHGSDAASKVGQHVLVRGWEERPLATADWALDAGLRVYSQSTEDGLLLYIFSQIGAADRRCIEIGGLDALVCNTTNLVVNWRWEGLFLEGDETAAQGIRDWFGAHPDAAVAPPTVVTQWLSTENVNDVLRDAGWTGDVDLLSIDIDGIDYWLWQALDAVSPRVVVCEYNACIPTDRSVTVPDSASFSEARDFTSYFGASLRALVKLGKQKGYRLVACNREGFNAFFVRDDVASDALPEVSVEAAAAATLGVAEVAGDWDVVSKLEWVEV